MTEFYDIYPLPCGYVFIWVQETSVSFHITVCTIVGAKYSEYIFWKFEIISPFKQNAFDIIIKDANTIFVWERVC